MTFKAKVVIALGAVSETLVASETLGADGITRDPAESAIRTGVLFLYVTFKTLVVLTLGAGAAAIVATAATTGAAAKLSHISALYAVVLFIAVSAAILTAMVTAGADVVVSAALAAEFTFNVLIPCKCR